MQKVAAYLLERREGMDLSKPRAGEAKRMRDEALAWLKSKGGTPTAKTGFFKPEDNGAGTFEIEEAADGDRTWWMLKLQEQTAEGRRVDTAISITESTDKISAYITLEVGWAAARIIPASDGDPRCPRIVRNLLGLPGRWYHGSSTLRTLKQVKGFDDGEGLAAELTHRDRSVPFIVVSSYDGANVLPELDEKLAYDFAGLANVVRVDEEASWALTDALGRARTCHSGSVRLYWPDGGAFHPLWTRDRLRASNNDEAFATRDRLRRQLRRLIFPAAALSIVRPRDIDAIRDASERAAMGTLRAKASSVDDYQQLADSFATDADRARIERNEARAQVEELQAQVAKLEAARQALQAHLINAKAEPANDELPPAAPEQEDVGPVDGEVRFYKKKYSAKTHDIMERVGDCGCNNWENAHAAPKAKKGVAKLEDRDDWKQFQHCASCTGGGMWKVTW